MDVINNKLIDMLKYYNESKDVSCPKNDASESKSLSNNNIDYYRGYWETDYDIKNNNQGGRSKINQNKNKPNENLDKGKTEIYIRNYDSEGNKANDIFKLSGNDRKKNNNNKTPVNKAKNINVKPNFERNNKKFNTTCGKGNQNKNNVVSKNSVNENQKPTLNFLNFYNDDDLEDNIKTRTAIGPNWYDKCNNKKIGYVFEKEKIFCCKDDDDQKPNNHKKK